MNRQEAHKIILNLETAQRVVAEQFIIDEARRMMKAQPKLEEFIMAMGRYFFVGEDLTSSLRQYAENSPLYKFLGEWDETLKLSGTGIRFTATGPIVRDW